MRLNLKTSLKATSNHSAAHGLRYAPPVRLDYVGDITTKGDIELRTNMGDELTAKLARLQSLLDYADSQQKEISEEYAQYLDGNIPPSLQIKIKNYFENARSLLDYIASDICVTVLRLSNKHKCYFPINVRSKVEFDKTCRINFPNLETVDIDVYAALASIQPFKSNDFSSLKLLSSYTNKNKHRDLSQQRVDSSSKCTTP